MWKCFVNYKSLEIENIVAITIIIIINIIYQMKKQSLNDAVAQWTSHPQFWCGPGHPTRSTREPAPPVGAAVTVWGGN